LEQKGIAKRKAALSEKILFRQSESVESQVWWAMYTTEWKKGLIYKSQRTN